MTEGGEKGAEALSGEQAGRRVWEALPQRPKPPKRAAISEVGILRTSVYIPRTAVRQTDLEVFDGVSTGKYTIGLGQTSMSFVTDREDVISLALTATSSLLRDAGVCCKDVGRLDVGTETIVDKSKSVKTSLMRLFTAGGNAEVEGLDTTNACYGSTAALFNSVAWMESSAWDGRYAIVVAADIGVYAPGAARPTGGAGAIAMLIGHGAAIRFEPGLRATVMGDTYDFFKADCSSEYPTVRGQLSVDTFVHAMDACYEQYGVRAAERDGHDFSMRKADFAVFHAPFNRLVEKSFARLVYNDFKRTEEGSDEWYASVERFRKLDERSAHRDGEAVSSFLKLSRAMYDEKCAPGAWLGKEIGNCYTASLYSSLAALVVEKGDELIGKRILMFGFGSGFAASMFSLRVVGSVRGVVVGRGLRERLADRVFHDAGQFDAILSSREGDYGRFEYAPCAEVGGLYAGSFYLKEVDCDGERTYSQVPYSDAPYSEAPRYR